MLCSKCGVQLNVTYENCPNCGNPISKEDNQAPNIENLTSRFMNILSGEGSMEDFNQLEKDLLSNIEDNLKKINTRFTGTEEPELIEVNPPVLNYEKPMSEALHMHTEKFLQQEFGNTGSLMISPLGFPSLGNVPILGSFDPGIILLLNTWSARHIKNVRESHPNNALTALREASEQLKNYNVLSEEDFIGYALGFAHSFAIPDLTQDEHKETLEGCIRLISIEKIPTNTFVFLVLAEGFSRRIKPDDWNLYLDFCEKLLKRSLTIITDPKFYTSFSRGLIFHLFSLSNDLPDGIKERINVIKTNYL